MYAPHADCYDIELTKPENKASTILMAFFCGMAAFLGVVTASSLTTPTIHANQPLSKPVVGQAKTTPVMKTFKTDENEKVQAATFQEAEQLMQKRLFLREAEKRRKSHLHSADLYDENWDGEVYKGSNWNIMTFLMLLVLVVPAAGLLFAYLSYGTVWGVTPY